jgi:DNA-binding MarR family transcriptional regulator
VRLRHALVRRSGLSQTELVALEHLVAAPSTPGDLARLLEVSTAASTGVVDRLERRGHVERRPHPQDRRRTEVHMTEGGREEILGHLMPMLVALRELDAGLDDAERAVVERYLRGARAAFDQVSDGGPD